jgi:hypothetical protein
MSEDTLAQKLAAWAAREIELKTAIEENKKLKTEIEAAVLAKGKELRLSTGPKCILTSRGEYDWHNVALQFEPDDDVIEKHTEIHWNLIAQEAAPDEETLEKWKKEFYTAGTEFAQCRVK